MTRRFTDLDELERALGQRECNFVVFRPTHLPGGLHVDAVSLRPESPPTVEPTGEHLVWKGSNRSSVRVELSDHTRRLRMKQFLYDWAPPAFDHPSLWPSENRSFPVGSRLGWVGTDYAGRPAASFHVDRTMIEFAVLEGVVDDAEWCELCTGLHPLDPGAREEILATPFALLAYQSRHLVPCTSVPVSYWDYRRSSAEVVLPASAAPPGLPGEHICPRPARGLRLDSIYIYGTESTFDEIDYMWCRDDDPGDWLHVLVSPHGSPRGFPFPPRPGRQPCKHAMLEVAGHEVAYAWLEALGPHQFAFRAGGLVVVVLFTPRAWTTKDWCLDLLTDLVHAADSVRD